MGHVGVFCCGGVGIGVLYFVVILFGFGLCCLFVLWLVDLVLFVFWFLVILGLGLGKVTG